MSEAGGQRRSNRWIIVVIVLAVLLCACSTVAVLAVVVVRNSGDRGIGRRSLGDLGAPAPYRTEREFDETFRVDTPTTVTIDNPVGSITVIGGAADEVSVSATMSARGSTRQRAEAAVDRAVIELSQKRRDAVQVTGRVTGLSAMGESPTIDMTVRIPRLAAVEIDADVGSVVVRDVRGSVQVKMNVGQVEIEDLTMLDDCTIRVDVGGIGVQLPSDSSFRLDARAGIGSVSCGFATLDTDRDRDVPGSRLRGQVGADPSVILTIEANIGDVVIRKR